VIAGSRRRVAALLAVIVAVTFGLLLLVAKPSTVDRTIRDPNALVWKHTLPSGLAPDVVGINNLALVGGRVVGFAYGPFGTAGDAAVTQLVSTTNGTTWESHPDAMRGLAVTAVARDDHAAWAVGQREEQGAIRREVWTSGDGISWKRVDGVEGLDFGAGGVAEVAVAGATLVALAHQLPKVEAVETAILRSEGGRRWERIPLPTKPSYGVRDIASGRTGFVITFANEDDNGAGAGEAWHSGDGRIWSRSPIVRTGGVVNFAALTATSTKYVIAGLFSPRARAGYAPTVWISNDGTAWSDALAVDSSASDGGLHTVISAGQGFVAYGNLDGPDAGGAAWVSADGRLWHRIDGWPRDGLTPSDAVAAPDFVVATSQTVRSDGGVGVIVSVGRGP
jgi:hypothetical protein